MPPKKTKDTLAHLGPDECAQVLRELLKRHRNLRGEANEIAENLIDALGAVPAKPTESSRQPGHQRC